METNKLICVDLFDKVIGAQTKEECHRKGILHRAFSIFIVNGDKILLQQREKSKYHSGGLWTNACCSHPIFGETLDEAVKRRLKEELGIESHCKELSSFVYYHKFGEELFEYEYDHIFVGEYEGDVKPNPEEIMNTKWVDISELAESLRLKPENYTVWFVTAAPFVIKKLRDDGIQQ